MPQLWLLIRKVCTRGNFIRRLIEPAREGERNKMAFSLDLKRVLISDSVDSCCKTILEANGIAVDLKTKLTKEELLAEIAVREGRLTWTVANRFTLTFGFHWADLFCRRTMTVWLYDQLQRWLQKWSRLEKILKLSVAREQASTTSIFQQLQHKESLLWSKPKFNSCKLFNLYLVCHIFQFS